MIETSAIPVSIHNDGIELRGELKSPYDGAPLVVLCHGIPLGKPDPTDGGYPVLADTLLREGYASLFVNFRGVGVSGGSFYIGGWYNDLKAIMEHISSLPVTPAGIFIAGFSAGGSLAIRYAGEQGGIDGVAALAAPASFTSIFLPENLDEFFSVAREIGIITDPGFPPSKEWCIEDMRENDAIAYVAGISPRPLLLIHGDGDETVPLQHSEELYRAAGEPKEIVVLEGAGHQLRKEPGAIQVIMDWLGKITSSAG